MEEAAAAEGSGEEEEEEEGEEEEGDGNLIEWVFSESLSMQPAALEAMFANHAGAFETSKDKKHPGQDKWKINGSVYVGPLDWLGCLEHSARVAHPPRLAP
jgi:hypothetical protein